MQLYELEKRLTMNVKFLAKENGINMENIYVNVQTSKGALGHYSVGRWLMGEKKEKVNELALNPEYFSNPIEVVDTILHELVHIYCNQNHIKDTSRNGYYHNKKFKDVAEKFGLLCEATDAGWNTTSKGNEERLEQINSTLPYPIKSDMIRRGDGKKKAPQTRKNKITFICPICGEKIKSAELKFLICMKDLQPLAPETENEDWNKQMKDYMTFWGGMKKE